MATFKIRPMNLAMGASTPLGQQWTYGSAHPIRAMLDPDYWRSEHHRLYPGDEIRILQLMSHDIGNMSNNRVLAYAEVLVVASSHKSGVTLEYLKPAKDLPLEDEEREGAPPQADVPPGRPRYIESGQTKWRGPQLQWSVFDDNGKELVNGLDKDTAVAIAEGKAPLPPAQPSAM